MELTHCTAERAGARVRADAIVRALRSAVGPELRGRRVSVWGLECCAAPGAPARVSGLRLVEALLDAGAAVSAHDEPRSLEEARARLGHRALFLEDAYLAAIEAEALVLTGAWPRARRPDLERLRACMARPFLLDASAGIDETDLVAYRFGGGFGVAGLGSTSSLGRPGDA